MPWQRCKSSRLHNGLRVAMFLAGHASVWETDKLAALTDTVAGPLSVRARHPPFCERDISP